MSVKKIVVFFFFSSYIAVEMMFKNKIDCFLCKSFLSVIKYKSLFVYNLKQLPRIPATSTSRLKGRRFNII